MAMRGGKRLKRIRVLAAGAILVLGASGGLGGDRATAAGQAAPSANIGDYVANKLDDFSATMRVTQFNERAGAKINESFGYIYRLKGDVQIRYKEENKLRLDGRLGPAKTTFIVNGTKQYVRASIGLNTTMDLGDSPGKRKTLLDVGLLSNGYLAYTQAEFRRAAPVAGVMCAQFKVSYRDKTLDTSHRLVWIDPRTKVTLKREEYSQVGKLNATFYYKDPKEIAPGVWFPSSIEVVNNVGEKAGSTAYSNVKVNQGLQDSLFKL